LADFDCIKTNLSKFANRLYKQGYVVGTEGNFSVRYRNNILITPTGMNKGDIKPDDLILCESNGDKISGLHAPSTEYKMHTAIYRKRSGLNSICHAHPKFATACSVLNMELNRAVLPEVISSIGIIASVKYAPPGSAELALSTSSAAANHDALLLESHGAVTLGKTIEEAFNRMEILEKYSQMFLISKLLGGPKTLSRFETERLLKSIDRISILDKLIFGDN
jgi:L-fuculose-phosphate aldolase